MLPKHGCAAAWYIEWRAVVCSCCVLSESNCILSDAVPPEGDRVEREKRDGEKMKNIFEFEIG